ncbi:unnamed protein product [Caenorhabditis nigoni]
MESSKFSSILSAISLNILQKTGLQKSLAFSPISISLSLVNNSLESSEPILSYITKNAPDFDLIDFKEKLESLVALLEEKNLSSTIWRYPFSVEKQKPFADFENNSKALKFLSMDFDENLRVSCEQEENKWAEDGGFKVLYIPMAHDDLSFVIFLPKSDSQKVLKNLDAEKFQNLIRELSPGFIDFEIPIFSIPQFSKILKSRNLKNQDKSLLKAQMILENAELSPENRLE